MTRHGADTVEQDFELLKKHPMTGICDICKEQRLKPFTRSELAAELCMREGVESFTALWGYHIAIKNAWGRNNGCASTDIATILVVKE